MLVLVCKKCGTLRYGVEAAAKHAYYPFERSYEFMYKRCGACGSKEYDSYNLKEE